MPSKKLPVVFSGLAPFMNNKILDRVLMSQYSAAGLALTLMAERAVAAGYEFMSIDRYLKQDSKRRALLISDMATGQDSSTGLIPSVCMSLESPLVAYRYYNQLSRRTQKFFKVWDWPGVVTRVPDRQRRFLPNAWPTTAKWAPSLVPWERRRFLATVCTNKRALQWRWQHFEILKPHQWIRDMLINLDLTYIRSCDPWIQSVELYLERLRAISYFAHHQDFDLYGGGWDTLRTEAERSASVQIAQSWRGKLRNHLYETKAEILRQYRFYLCFENTVFPGYLTEKVFDCFFSGVIPIYLGDPDVQQRVPSDAFIDARQFQSYPELDAYLQAVTPSRAQDYLEAARQFLLSEAFRPFTADAFADTVLAALNEVYAQYQ